MTIKLSVPKKDLELKPRLVVFGVGGAGSNAVNNMIQSDLQGVDFIVGNTDAQSLALSTAERKIQLGLTITEGLGAGSRPDIGRAAAEEGLDEILEALEGTHMAFITAGMGGGTGTGAGPVIARAARERGILTVGVVTKPFHFEGQHRMKIAEEGIEELQQFVDTLIIIPNQNLFRVANEKTTFADAFKMADDVLYSGVRGVTDLMVMPGLINLDFADIRTVMSEMGKAMMGTGEAEGEGRAVKGAEAAISNPLLDEISMKGALGVLINITGGHDLTLFEVDEAANRIREEVDPNANIIFGSTFDESMDGTMRVSVVATGIEANLAARPKPTTISLVADNPRPQRVAEPAPEPSRPGIARGYGGTAAAVAQPRIEPTFEPVVDETPAETSFRQEEEDFDIPAPAVEPAPEPEIDAAAAAEPIVATAEPEPADEAVVEPDEPVAEAPVEADVFLAPPPVERERRVEVDAPADPFAAAELANASPSEPAVQPAPDPSPARRPSLFRRVTQAARELTEGGEETRKEARPRAEPAIGERRAEPARGDADVKPIQPRLGGLDPADRPQTMQSDEDLLEIPAFLRRQAN